MLETTLSYLFALIILFILIYIIFLRTYFVRRSLKKSIKRLQNLKVSTFLNKKTFTLEENSSLFDAIDIFDKEYANVIVIKNGKKATGIITKKNLVSSIQNASQEELEKLKVKTIMQKKFISCSPDITLDEAFKILSESKSESLVVNDTNFIGTLDYSNILALFRQSKFTIHLPPILRNTVNKKIIKIPPQKKLSELIKELLKTEEEYALIFEGEKLKGIITLKDVLSAIKRDIPRDTPVENIMSPEVFFLNPGTAIYDFLEASLSREFNQIPIIVENKVIGIAKLKSIVNFYYEFLSEI